MVSLEETKHCKTSQEIFDLVSQLDDTQLKDVNGSLELLGRELMDREYFIPARILFEKGLSSNILGSPYPQESRFHLSFHQDFHFHLADLCGDILYAKERKLYEFGFPIEKVTNAIRNGQFKLRGQPFLPECYDLKNTEEMIFAIHYNLGMINHTREECPYYRLFLIDA